MKAVHDHHVVNDTDLETTGRKPAGWWAGVDVSRRECMREHPECMEQERKRERERESERERERDNVDDDDDEDRFAEPVFSVVSLQSDTSITRYNG
jgi:hypothetical protein